MPREVNRYRLNTMSACVKQYDDGSEILQSYTTDVVKKTPDGKYIRLWHCWSPTTNKHVHTYCGRTFRDIPFEDGTVEDRKPEYRRKGYTLKGRQCELTPAQWKYHAQEYAKSISAGILYVGDDNYGFATGLTKDLRQIYKQNKKYLSLIKVLDACARKKEIRGDALMNAIVLLYKFDFLDLWINGGLSVKYPSLTIHP